MVLTPERIAEIARLRELVQGQGDLLNSQGDLLKVYAARDVRMREALHDIVRLGDGRPYGVQDMRDKELVNIAREALARTEAYER